MEVVKRALGELHETGLIHGDPVRTTFSITSPVRNSLTFELCFSSYLRIGSLECHEEHESATSWQFNDPSNKCLPCIETFTSVFIIGMVDEVFLTGH